MTKKSNNKVLSAVLEGKVFLVEMEGNKELSREELNGDYVLSCVISGIDQDLNLKLKKKVKASRK